MKKKLPLIIIFLSCFIYSKIFSQGAVAPSAGEGTSGSPYEIATWQNLYWISASDALVPTPNQATRWAAYYKQTADINFADASPAITTWDVNKGWTPIGNVYPQPAFTGNYNGQGFTISNLYINRSITDYLSLFGYLIGGTIKNVGLVNVTITGRDYVGGLVGVVSSGSVINCYATGSVGGRNNLGGLVGYASSGTITNCYSLGTLSGTSYVGGLVGYFTLGTLATSYSSKTVNATGFNVGGLVGYNNGTINNSYAIGGVSSTSNTVGGLVGSNNKFINKCYSTGSVSGNASFGGLVGANSNLVGTTNCFWDITTSGLGTSNGGTGKLTSEMKDVNTFFNAGWDITIWNIGDGINSGYPYLDWQNSGGTPLPVEIVTFSAAVTGSIVRLNWTAVMEINNYGFEVERTEATNVKWNKIAFVIGAGNSTSTKEYNFTDNFVIPGKYLYRLKQVDNNGQFEYSNEIEIEIGLPEIFVLSQNYPNPFNPSTTIKYSIPASNFVTLKVYDVLGNEVSNLVNEYKNAGSYEVNFDGSQLSSGTYFYKLESGAFSQTKKLQLLK